MFLATRLPGTAISHFFPTPPGSFFHQPHAVHKPSTVFLTFRALRLYFTLLARPSPGYAGAWDFQGVVTKPVNIMAKNTLQYFCCVNVILCSSDSRQDFKNIVWYVSCSDPYFSHFMKLQKRYSLLLNTIMNAAIIYWKYLHLKVHSLQA